MNIAFFLTPKKEVVYEKVNNTMRQAIERMEYHRYTAIPILDDEGKYVATLTEGDILWTLKNNKHLNFLNTENVLLADIPMHMTVNPVHIDQDVKDLMQTSIDQNFVPVVDDNDIFIGIIKRSDLLKYFSHILFKNMKVIA